MALEETLGESFLYLGLTLQVGLALVINLIETNTHLLVGLVETGIYPVVHLFPQGAYFWVVVLPFHQHLVSLLNQWSLLLSLLLSLLSGHTVSYILCGEFLYLFAVVFIESHVVVANQVVALLAR